MRRTNDYEVWQKRNRTVVIKNFNTAYFDTLWIVPFKFLPLRVNALLHAILPPTKALGEILFFESFELLRLWDFYFLQRRKMSPFHQLSASEKAKSHWRQIWEIGRVVKRGYLLFGQAPLHTNCLVCVCVFVVKKPWLVTPQFQPTDFVFSLSFSDVICTVNLQSLRTSWFTLVMFSSVVVVESCPVLGSSSTSSRPFTKCLRHSKICVISVTSLPQTSLKSLKHSVGVYFSFT